MGYFLGTNEETGAAGGGGVVGVGGQCHSHFSTTKMKVDSIIPRALGIGHLQKYSRKNEAKC